MLETLSIVQIIQVHKQSNYESMYVKLNNEQLYYSSRTRIFISRSISQSVLKAASIMKYIYIFEIINYWTIHFSDAVNK